jgi:TolB-like protein
VNKAQNQQLQSAETGVGLGIRLLGPVAIATVGKPVTVTSKKARALLGYLALREGIAVSRSVLTGLLWGERSEGQARASLRQALSELRGALAGAAPRSIIASNESVTWAAGSAWIDAKVVEAAAGSADDGTLRKAAALVGGELMEGLSVGEAGFEQWLAAERERFRLLACKIHARLMERAEHGGRLEEALSHGLALLSFDPLQESVHRTLMRVYAAQGRHDAALAQYERCHRALADGLGVQPEPETAELARSIRTDRRGGPEKLRGAAPRDLEPEQGKLPGSPDRLAIAVLPFENMSGDAEQQYFSDGITEDIITEVSRYRSLLVIARHSCFQFRGPSVDFAAVRRKLGVQFVVEGSIRKIGSRLRLTVQLIDAATESHVWAERYDREAGDIFGVQDDMTRAIAATLEGRVAASGAEQAKRRPTKDWRAYDYFLQGREQYHRYRFIEAEPFFARAVELDRGYAQAHALRAQSLLGWYWTEPRAATMDEALDCARKALSLDDTDPWCQMVMGFVLTHRGERELAGPYFDRAVALNPTDVQIMYMRAWWLARVGRAEQALETLDITMRRDPFPPAWFWEARGIALFAARRYDDVIQTLARMNHLHVWDHAYTAACHAYLNHPAEARAAASEVLRADPHFTLSRYAQVERYTLPAELEHLLNGMRMAGLPE